MYIVYTDDSIIAGPNQEDLDAIVEYLKKENLGFIVEGTLEEFLGVNIYRIKDDSIHMIQLHLIEQILKDLRDDNPKTPSKSTSVQPSKILHYFKQAEDLYKNFHYRSVAGKLNYLENCCRPDIDYATHHCARC